MGFLFKSDLINIDGISVCNVTEAYYCHFSFLAPGYANEELHRTLRKIRNRLKKDVIWQTIFIDERS